MSFRVVFLFILLLLVSCLAPSALRFPSFLKMEELKDKNVLHLESANLSEDGSVLSTKDDEVFIFFYQLENNSPINLIFSAYHEFKELAPAKNIIYNCDVKSGTYLLILLEQDSNKDIEMYDQIIRDNLEQMISDHSTKDYESIATYLGDDDILAIQKMTYDDQKVYTYIGSHRGDQYEYRSLLKTKSSTKRND